MNEDGTPIEDQQLEAGAAGAPEGAVNEPTADDVQAMYDELGIKAPKSTAKPKGRPKATDVRTKDSAKDGDDNSDTSKQGTTNVPSKSKDAPASDEDDAAGDKTDAKSSKERGTNGKVSDKSEEAGDGVRKSESRAEEDSERRDEEDTDERDSSARQGENESDDASEAEQDADDEGKRPGKSNPRVEQRFQKLTSEVKEREQRIEELERQLQETVQKQQEAQIAQEDPEYTIDDFRKVRDEEGNIVDLDPERAELAWRRWKDGFEQRKAEREAEVQRQQAEERRHQETSEQLMRSSVEAYDTLTGLIDEYPELDKNSASFDPEFSSAVLPIIEEAIAYAPGTEPGNEEGIQPVIIGFRINPKRILEGMNRIKTQKRSLPLNGVNDNVEVRSNVNVPHSRSSDPTVHAANALYAELGINKRI